MIRSFCLAARTSPLVASSIVSCLALAGCGGAAESGKGADSSSSEGHGLIGNPAPDFSVAKAAGAKGTVSLADLHGKVVLVDFWGTFCEPCKKSFPKLQDLYTKYSSSGLRIVGISEDEEDDKGKIPEFASSFGAKFSLGWDADKSVAHAYKPQTMPSSFIIDKAGVIRYAHVGYHDGEEVGLEKELKELLEEKD
jgi:cytochrome c biogenesis protein CcmG, thiol:disulfide interchange protein DsbE